MWGQIMDKVFTAIESAEQAEVTAKRSRPEVKATSLDALSKSFVRDEIVITFKNPTGGDDLHITVRRLTPGERFEVFDSIFSNDAIKSLNLTANEEKNIDKLLNDPMEFRRLMKDQYELALDVVQRCIVEPAGVTLEILQGWDEVYVARIFNVVISEANAVSRFPEENNGAGE